MANIQKRTNQKGNITYRVQVRIKGYPSETASFKRLTDAKQWAQNTESAMREKRYFKTAASKKHTVTDMIARYLKWLQQENPKRLPDVGGMLKWWDEQLGHCILAELTVAQITSAIDILSQRTIAHAGKKPKPISTARVNRYIAAFSHMCTIAYREWEWLEQNPMTRIKKKREPRGRVRFLDDEERKALLDACKESASPALYPIVILAISTGMRKGEILNLKWKDIDFERKIITLHETKNNERRVVPLVGHAFEVIQECAIDRNTTSEYVFPSNTRLDAPITIQASWETAVKKVKLNDFRFHDLRHSAASYLAMNGASLAEIAEVLGHKTLQMVKRYAHLSEAHTSKVVAAMNERIFG